MGWLHSDPVECAAAYLFYLCGNHPFVDGNKRAALATCLVVLSLNDLLPTEELDADAWENLTLEVASGRLSRNETNPTPLDTPWPNRPEFTESRPSRPWLA